MDEDGRSCFVRLHAASGSIWFVTTNWYAVKVAIAICGIVRLQAVVDMSEPEQMRAQSSGALDPTVVPPSNIESPTNASMGPQERTNSGEAKPFGATATVVDVGGQLGPYLLLEKLGEGGMGAVFKARHTKLDRLVALKVLRPQLLSRPDSLSRFEREMKAVGKVHHPNVVQALDAGDFGGVHYLSMEYVEGQDLQALMKDKGPMSVINACEVIRQAAVGLAVAHKLGLVHRDIKPSNLFVVKQTGQVKILDMGLALLSLEEASAALTSTGQCFGTPDYMAPEQWEDAHTCDARADLYSLGCTLYFLLAGRPPYSSDTHRSAANKMKGHMIDPAPDLRKVRQDVPDGVMAIYDQLMAKSPDNRFSTAEELADAIAAFSSGKDAPSQSAGHADPQSVTGSWQPRSTIASPGDSRKAVLGNGVRPSSAEEVPRPYWLFATVGAVALSLIGVVVFVMTSRTANTESMNTVTAESKTALPPLSSVSPQYDQSTKAVAGPPVNDPIGDPWVPLFNGRDLAGWGGWQREAYADEQWKPEADSGWRVEDGVLINAGRHHELHCLATERDDFENFHLRVEFRMNADGNSGLWLLNEQQPLQCINVQIWNDANNSTGTINPGRVPAGSEGACARHYRILDANCFYTLELIADGDCLRTVLDGETMVDIYLPRIGRRSGRITLEDHTNSKTEFRKVEVRRLAPGRRQPWLDNSLGMRLGYVPAGEMHRQNGETFRLPAPILMGIHEVRAADFRRVMGTKSSKPDSDSNGNLPMTFVSVPEAQKFCEVLSKLPIEQAMGRRYRIPSTDEWEYACRAGTDTPYFFGEQIDQAPRYGWWGMHARNRLHPVGLLWPNPWGFYDMLGNANEWTLGHGDKWSTVCRGGSYLELEPAAAEASMYQNPGGRFPRTGFRVVCQTSETLSLEEELAGLSEIRRSAARWIFEQGGQALGGTQIELNEADASKGKIIEVQLSGSHSVTDAGLKMLHRSPNLESLDLSKTPITDAALFELRMFPRLHYLNVSGTKVTNEGVEAFRKDKPDCEVVH